jgi:hypothetical protein
MGTNVSHQARQADPFSPELSPALWLLPKGPSPKEAFQLTETLDFSVNDRPALASRQTSRLTAKKAERSLASRFEGLLSVSVAIGTHHDIEGPVSALVTELLRVVDFFQPRGYSSGGESVLRRAFVRRDYEPSE